MKDPVTDCNVYKEKGCCHVDGLLCDFKTCSMRIDYENKYKAILKLLTVHNQSCENECKSRAKYCIDYLAVGRTCNDCPKFYKVDIK